MFKNSPPIRRLVSIKEAAKYIGVSPDTLRNWERAGKLTPLRTQGGQRRYRLRELNKLIADRQPALYQQVRNATQHVIPTQAGIQKYFNRFLVKPGMTMQATGMTEAGGNDDGSNSKGSFWTSFYLAHHLSPITRHQLGDKTAILLSLGIITVIAISVWSGVSHMSSLRKQGTKNNLHGFLVKPGMTMQATGMTEGRGNDNTPDSKVLAAASQFGTVNGVLSTSDESGNLQLEITVPTKIEKLQIGGKDVLPASEVVSSLQGKVGALKLVAGTDISIDSLTISDSSTLDTVRGRGGCSACIKNADVADDLTLSGGTINSTPIGASTASTGAFTTITASSTLTVTGATTLSSTLAVTGASTLSSTLTVAGATTLNGNVTLGDATSDSLTFTGRIASSFVPTTTGTYDLGSSSLQWSKLYLTGVATIGGQSTFTSIPTGTGVGDGVIYINPASVPDTSYTLFGIAVGGVEKLRMSATGNIIIGGDLIGPSGGSVGYWSRSSTSVYPATSNDIVSYSSNNTTNALSVTATGASANAINLTADSVTTGNGLSLSVDGLTTGNGISLTSTSTAGGVSGASYLLNLARSGTNANASHTAYGIYSAVTDTGTTSTNVAGYFSASGASTNYGLLVAAGNVGIGTATPGSVLTVSGTTTQSGGATSLNDSSNYATTINTGTSTGAVTIGNSSAGAIALSTGSTFGVTTTTGAQTFTSANVSGATTSSAWVFTDSALTTGTGLYLTSSSITQGKLAQLSTGSANTLTTGTLLDLRTTATSLTGATGTGSILNLDWSPGSSTTATGDLFSLNIGTNGTTTGNLFNILDASSSIFSVSETAVTSALPFSETAPGDVSIAYDLVFTNPTASFITSSSSLNIVAGDSPDSNNLILSTYNQGEIVLNPAITTGTGIDFNNATLTTGIGMNLASTTLTSGKLLNLSPTYAGSAVTGYGQYINGADSTTSANTDYQLYSTLALTGAAAKTGVGLYSTVSSSSTTADTILALDLATTHTGNISTGTKSVYGLRSQPSSAGATDTGGTINTYGGYFDATGASGGTSLVTGVYIADVSGADTNVGLCFDCDGTWTSSTVASGIQFGTDANAVTLYRSASDTLRTGDNLTVDLGLTVTGVEGSNYFTLTSGDAAISDGSLSITDDDDAASFSVTNNTATTIGAGINTAGVVDVSSTSLTTGNLVNLETTTTLTTGKVLNISSTSTALTTGNLLSLDWSPGSVQTTAATGDLFKLNIGSNASNFAGNLFNILDSSSSIFSVSKTAVTSAIPISVTAPGDVSAAYDIAFTNPTASYITSLAPLYLVAGESFSSSDLTLTTYNMGSVVIEGIVTSSSTAATKYAQYINTGDTTTTADTIYGSYITNALTGNAAKIGYGLYGTVTSSSTTADTLYGADLATDVTGIMTTGTRNVYGLRSQPTAGAESTGGTTNVYSGYFKTSGDVGALGTINNYGLYVANGTYDTDGTNTAYGLYVESITGADTNYAAIFAGGNVGVGDTTPDAIFDIDSTSTSGGDFLITNTGISASGSIATITANSLTAGDVLTLNATGMTTGSLIVGTGSSSTGVTDHFVKLTADVGSGASLININPDFSGSAVTGYGIYNVATDATANANTDYGYYGSLALTGNAAKTGIGLYSTVTSSSTTADTLISSDLATDVTGIMTTGTRNIYGLRSQPSAGAESTGGTTNVYGGYFKTTGDVAAGGTINNYGLYVANGTYDTDGTSAATGLYVESITGAGTNYAAIFAGGSVGIGDTSPAALLTVGSGDLFQVNTNGSLTTAQSAVSGGQLAFALTPGAHTAMTAEVSDTAILAHTNTITGAITTQRFNRFMLPTITAASSLTITNAATLYVEGAPAVAASAVITNPYALWIDAGTSRFDGAVAYGAQQTFVDSDATPDVSGGSNWITNTTTFTITDFDAGSVTLQAGHIIYVESAGAITYDVTTSGLEGGTTDIVTATGDMTTWIYDGTQWKLINWVKGSVAQTGADLAEAYVSREALEPGDVVSVGSDSPDVTALVEKSKSAYDKRAIGIISTQPGIVLRDGTETGYSSYPVALAGRVPVKVSLENGQIVKGDFLTSSSVPGVAMKATRPGQVIGKALEGFSSCVIPTTNTVIPAEAGIYGNIFGSPIESGMTKETLGMTSGGDGMTSCSGKILTFVNPSFADPQDVLANLTFSPDGSVANLTVIPTTNTVIPAEAGIYGNIFGSPIESGMTKETLGMTSGGDGMTNEIATSQTPRDDIIFTLQTRLADLTSRLEKLEASSSASPVLGDTTSLSNTVIPTPSSVIPTTNTVIPAEAGIQKLLDNLSVATASAEALTVNDNLSVLGNSNFNSVGITGNLTVGLLQISSVISSADCHPALDAGSKNIDGIPACAGMTEVGAGVTSLRVLGTLKFQDAFGDGVSIDQYGNVKISGTVKAKKYEVDTNDAASASLGSGTIPAGATSVIIKTTAITTSSKTLITPVSPTGGRPLIVSEKAAGSGFTVSIEKPYSKAISFDWWIVN